MSDEGMSDGEDLALDFLGQKVSPASKSIVSSIKRKNRRQKSLEKWQVTQIASFMRVLAETAADIVTAHRKKRVATVAWLTRNLLELSVWIAYCTSSKERARAFWNDALKDASGLANRMEQFDAAKVEHRREFLNQGIRQLFDPTEAQEMMNEINNALDRIASEIAEGLPLLTDSQLSKMAAFIGEETIRDNHLSVSDAAKAAGRLQIFAAQNKTLSKFAHPTALLIHLPRINADNHPLDFFIEDAMFLAMECISLASAFEAAAFPKDAIH